MSSDWPNVCHLCQHSGNKDEVASGSTDFCVAEGAYAGELNHEHSACHVENAIIEDRKL